MFFLNLNLIFFFFFAFQSPQFVKFDQMPQRAKLETKIVEMTIYNYILFII